MVDEHNAFIAMGQRITREREAARARFEMRSDALLARLEVAAREFSQQQTEARERRRRWMLAAVVACTLLLCVRAMRPVEVVPTAQNLLVWAVQEEGDGGNWSRVRFTAQPSAEGEAAPISFEADVERGAARGVPSRTVPTPIAAMQRETGIDLARPLSAAAFQAWWTAVPGRRDRVTVSGDLLILETRGRGRVSMAALTVQRTSYRVVGQTWVVPGVGRLEIEGLRARERESSPAPEPTGRSVAARTPDEDGANALEQLELTARQALFDLAHDDTLAVATEPTKIHVLGSVGSIEEKRRVERRFEGVPRIAVSLRITSSSPPAAVVALPHAGAAAGESEERAAFAVGLQQRGNALDRRLVATVHLAERYTPRAVEALSPEARTQFGALLARHITAWRTKLFELDARLMLLTGVTERCALVKTVPIDWRDRVRRSAVDGRKVRLVLDGIAERHELSSDASTIRALAQDTDRLWNEWCDRRQ